MNFRHLLLVLKLLGETRALHVKPADYPRNRIIRRSKVQ